ncbi:hypothetical protein GCM10020220_092000 [Nonomuraea rubra]
MFREYVENMSAGSVDSSRCWEDTRTVPPFSRDGRTTAVSALPKPAAGLVAGFVAGFLARFAVGVGVGLPESFSRTTTQAASPTTSAVAAAPTATSTLRPPLAGAGSHRAPGTAPGEGEDPAGSHRPPDAAPGDSH